MSDEMGNSILGTIRKLLGTSTGQGAGDAELLRRFVQGRDESAFELLVWRHAGLVLGVCQKLLPDREAVEDAFQATFVVLARKAGNISRRESLPGWLHRVAFRVALRSRRQAARHQCGQSAGLDLDQIPAPPTASPVEEEVCLVLHEEVLRLPPRYRLPVVCCYLDGKTYEQAAVELGCSRGTVSGRLARARELLRRRLSKRGVELGAAVLAEELASHAVRTASLGQRIGGLVEALGNLTTNESAGAGLSARAAALAEGVIGEMFWKKCRWAALVAVSLSLAGLGGALATGRPGVAPQPAEERAAEDEQAARRQETRAKKQIDPLQEVLDRARVRRQLASIGTALGHYHSNWGHLPPPANTDKFGKPLLSWRVALLPFLEQDNLYQQFKLDEPWDSPHNRKLIARMPRVFAAIGKTPRPHMTYFQYIVGPDAVFKSHRSKFPLLGGRPSGPGGMMGPMGGGSGGGPSMGGPRGASRPGGGGVMPGMGGTGMSVPGMGAPGGFLRRGEDDALPMIPQSFPDGTSNTLLVVEAGTPVVWTRPDDVPYDPKKPLPRLGGQFASVIHGLTADWVVHAMPRRLDERTLRAAITPAGGEPSGDLDQAASHGATVRQALVDRLRKRNTQLKEEAAVLRDTLKELKEEMDSLRWAVEKEKLLAQDPTAAALQKENTQLEAFLRETRDDARKMFAEIKRLQQELRKQQKKE
jgi:RNA polymerase sigma factor (sigma-70 family)